MIHRIVEDAVKQIEQYEVEKVEEKYEMIYCLARIEANEGYRNAYLTLNEHLDKHYKLKNGRIENV